MRVKITHGHSFILEESSIIKAELSAVTFVYF